MSTITMSRAAVKTLGYFPSTPVALSGSRDPQTGRFAPTTARWGVQEVLLRNGRVGYRLGDAGQIFAQRKSADRHAMELVEYRKRAMAAIWRTLHPECGPIKSADRDAVALLREKLAGMEACQAQYKAINAAHRAYLKKPASLDKVELPETAKAMIRTYKPAYSWEPHPIAPYQFTNLGARIRQCKARIEQVSAMQAGPMVERSVEMAEGETTIKIVENPEVGRIQLRFPGKPDRATIATLKSHGFRWAPSEAAWQRHLNGNGRYAAEQVVKAIAAF